MTFAPVEFPSDNPELWRARPPRTALSLLAAELLAAEPVPEAIAVAEPTVAVAPAAVAPAAEHVALAVPAASASAPPDGNDESDFGPSATDDIDPGPEVEVIEFADEDFAGLENESPASAAPDTPDAPDAFELFGRTLVEVALAAGAPGRVVEVLPGMLGLTRLDVRALDDEAIDSLIAADMLARNPSGAVVRSEAFVTIAQVWRATLLGEEADFSACTAMLDEWSAGLIAALAGSPAQKESYRRELRNRGVAAFGLIAA